MTQTDILDRFPNKCLTAFEHTYGKGINPQSVEKMKATLAGLIGAIKSGDQEKINLYIEVGKEALTAAKLT